MAVSDTDVKAIIDTNRDITPFIAHAVLIYTEELTLAGHSASRQDLITLYLAAHFVAITEERGGLKSSRTGDASESYADHYGPGLNLTRYGQHAIALETQGILAAMASTNNSARLSVV